MKTSSLLLLLPLIACSAPAHLTPGEHDALAAVDLVLAVEAEQGEAIWPGFSLVEEPILIHRPGGRSFLIGAPEAPGEALSLPSFPHLPRILAVPAGEVHVNPSILFSRDVPVRGATAFMIRHTDAMKRLRFFRLLVHEVFHRYQERHFLRDRTAPLCRYPMEDVHHMAAALVEQRLLARTLSASSEADARAGLVGYLAVRLHRHEHFPEGAAVRVIEDWEERLEGTARYVEERYASAAGLLEPGAMVAGLRAALQHLAPKDLQKWRYYRTGAALLVAVDRLSPDGHWHHAVDDGQTPLDVALDAVGPLPMAPAPAEPLLLARAVRVVAEPLRTHLEQERRLLEAWVRQGSLHVSVVACSAGAVTYSGRGVTFHLPDCSLFISDVSWFIDRIAGLDVRGRSVVLDGSLGREAYRLEFHGDLGDAPAIHLDGVPLPPDAIGEREFSQSLHIQGERWRLDSTGAGHLDLAPGELGIHLTRISAPSP